MDEMLDSANLEYRLAILREEMKLFRQSPELSGDERTQFVHRLTGQMSELQELWDQVRRSTSQGGPIP